MTMKSLQNFYDVCNNLHNCECRIERISMHKLQIKYIKLLK